MKLQLLSHLKQLSSYCKNALIAFIISSFLFAESSFAAIDYGVGRIRECTADAAGNISIEGLDWNPTFGGKDIEFVLSNTTCIAVILSSYAAVKASVSGMNYACGTGNPVPRITPSPIMDFYDIGKATAVGPRTPSCIATTATAWASLATALAQISAIYGVAKDVFEITHICGHNWMRPSDKTFNFSIPYYKKTVQNKIEDWMRNPTDQNNDGIDDNLNFSKKEYREWYYGGVEFEDNPDSGETCFDPRGSQSAPYPKQKYYLKGLESGNYNCKEYLVLDGKSDPAFQGNVPFTETRLNDFKQAYECCKKRSKEYICISGGNVAEQYVDGIGGGVDNIFCRAGSKCTINDVIFKTEFLDSERLICAESYSLCPYNFSIDGGSEYCDFYRDGIWNGSNWDMITIEDITNGQCAANSEIRNPDCTYNAKAGQCQNYCQYLTHCTKTSYINPYQSSIVSPYFSEACLNFQGDSQNKASFQDGFIIVNQKHFSAPIAQCMKETLENVFYNRAGHSKCLNINETPSAGGICPSGMYVTDGNFVFKKGNKVLSNSFFETIQNNLQFLVKLVLTFSIMLYGMNLLMWKTDIRNKKDILIYILKIALVLYFATGDAWQTMFFNGVYGASTEFSRMVFKIRTQEDVKKRDGCQFGRVYLPDGTETFSDKLYPPGKEYLSMWDTLDCKLMRYLGFGPSASAANIVMLILASYLTGPIGIYFALSVMIFGILLLAAIMRALHIFLSSAVSIIIMVFVSPIIIPLVLFEKTKNIFENWLKELISFALQPMILFAYIAIFIMVIDETLIGSATFSGVPPFKTMNCSERCINTIDGSTVPWEGDQAPACDEDGQKIIDPLDDSVACLIGVDSFGKFPGLEIIGLSIPIVINLFEKNVKERMLTILKGALVMYLIYKFMDEIPGITSALIGGTPLPGSNANGADMFMKTLGTARDLQKRLARGSMKLTKNLAKKATKGISSASNKGKNTGDVSRSGIGDHVSKSKGGGQGDSAGKGNSGSGNDDSGKGSSSSGDSAGKVNLGGSDDSSSQA